MSDRRSDIDRGGEVVDPPLTTGSEFCESYRTVISNLPIGFNTPRLRPHFGSATVYYNVLRSTRQGANRAIAIASERRLIEWRVARQDAFRRVRSE